MRRAGKEQSPARSPSSSMQRPARECRLALLLIATEPTAPARTSGQGCELERLKESRATDPCSAGHRSCPDRSAACTPSAKVNANAQTTALRTVLEIDRNSQWSGRRVQCLAACGSLRTSRRTASGERSWNAQRNPLHTTQSRNETLRSVSGKPTDLRCG